MARRQIGGRQESARGRDIGGHRPGDPAPGENPPPPPRQAPPRLREAGPGPRPRPPREGGGGPRTPIPPRPLFHGSRRASAKAVATTASTALPPAASTSAPTAAATPFWATTMPPRETAAGFFTTQFCINGAISAHLARIDPAHPHPFLPRKREREGAPSHFTSIASTRLL